MEQHTHRGFWSSPSGLTAICLIAAASFFLLAEHRAHLFEALPYLILLACPLMHVFMHGSHHGHHPRTPDAADPDAEQAAYRRGLEEGRRQGQGKDTSESDD